MSASMALSRVYALWLTNSQGIRIIINLAAITLPIAVFVDIMIASYCNTLREGSLRGAFRKGAVPSPEGFVVERKELAAEVERILQPPEGYAKYHLIVGDHGTGKTTLVRQVAHERSGIIYVSIPKNVSLFGEEFAHAINWSPENNSGWLSKTSARVFGIKVLEGCEKPRF